MVNLRLYVGIVFIMYIHMYFLCIRVETSAVEEEAQLRKEIEDELEEIREDFQDHYVVQFQDYHSQLSKWKVFSAFLFDTIPLLSYSEGAA